MSTSVKFIAHERPMPISEFLKFVENRYPAVDVGPCEVHQARAPDAGAGLHEVHDHGQKILMPVSLKFTDQGQTVPARASRERLDTEQQELAGPSRHRKPEGVW
jgi:hypothetical protein